MKKISNNISLIALVLGAIMILYSLGYISGGGTATVIGIFGLLFGIAYIFAAVLTMLNVSNTAVDLTKTCIYIAAFPLFMFVYYLCLVIQAADFLTITTGEIWRTMTVCGYCQGDWCDIVYKTTDADSDQFARISGELYLGRGKEFALLDDDGFGGCSGYFVADCQIRNDEDYKKVLCDMAGCSIEETAVRLISDIRTETHYDYKTI